MNPDPLTPLVKRDDDPFERALLRAAQRERAPRGSDRRLLAALGVGVGSGGALTAAVAKYTSKVGPKGLFATIAVSIAAVVAGSWVATSSYETTPEPSANATPPAVTVAPAPEPAAAQPNIEALPSTRVEDLPSSPPAPKAASKPGSANVTPTTNAAASSTDGTPSLAREVELVQSARAALAKGDASEALRTLDVYDREFPKGTLGPEARVLRIEALVRAGGERNVARANTLGDAFLAEHPNGPQARRVRAVLGRAP